MHACKEIHYAKTLCHCESLIQKKDLLLDRYGWRKNDHKNVHVDIHGYEW